MKKLSINTFILILLISMTLMGCNLVRRSDLNTNLPATVSTAAASPTSNTAAYLALPTSAPVEAPTQPAAQSFNPTAAASSTSLPNKLSPTQTALPAVPSKSSKTADDLSSMLDDLTKSLSSTDTLQDVK
jgi:hypothetical protein